MTEYNSNLSQEIGKKLLDFVNQIEVIENEKEAKNELVNSLTKIIESQERITEENLVSLKNQFNKLTNSDDEEKFAELLTQYNKTIIDKESEQDIDLGLVNEVSDKIWKEFVENKNSRFTEAKMNACALLCDNTRTGYQRLENQLYRVEIHQSGLIGDDTSPTFKWSRENGSIASPIVGKIEGNTINIKPSSDDAWSSSQPGQQWIEITNEEQELKGIPGAFALINRVISGIKIEFSNPTPTISENLTKVRRWDSKEIEIKSQEWIDLEGGIKVKFSSDLAYETGDYWLIPARTATNDIEWPHDNGEPAQPIPQLPRGIRHDYAPLGLVRIVKINQEVTFEGFKQEDEENQILDRRTKFPSLQNSFDKENGGTINGNVTIKDTLDVDKSTNLAINEGNVAIGIQETDTQAKLHTKSSGWFPEDSTQWPKITEILNPEKTQIKVSDATGLDKGVLLKIEGVSELVRVTDIDDTTLTIKPGLQESIDNDVSFQYQQPIARFDSQLNGQVENQLTVVGDGTVLAKDIKAKTLEVGQLFSTALQTETLDVNKSTNLAINEGNVAIGIQETDTQAKLHTKSSGWFPEDSTQWPKITEILNPEKTQIKVSDATGLDKGVLLKIEGVSELVRVTDIDDTTLTIKPGLQESIDNENEQLSFQYQQPIARFDSQLNGKIENQLTVVGDGTVLAKDIKANTLDVNKSANLAINEGNVAIGSKANEAELGVTGNVTITDTLAVDKSTNLAINQGNVAIGIQETDTQAKLHTKSSGWFPEDSTQWPKITEILNPEKTQIKVSDATGLDKGVLLKIEGVSELVRVTDIDDTTLTIKPGLQESIDNDVSFQYQQPIARFDSQLNGQVENQLTVVGDGTVLAKDIKAKTLEVGQLFSTALQTETLDVNKSTNLAINEGNVAIGIQETDTQAKLHTKSSGWFPEDSTQWPKITEILNPEKTQIKVSDATGLDKGVLLKIEGVSELVRVTDIDDTTLTIKPGLQESIDNDVSFQYQQPIARFDSQLNGQVENQLTVVGDGTVLAKDIKAQTLEVGQVFSTVLPTGDTEPLLWTSEEIQTILNSLKPVKIPDSQDNFNASFSLEGISDLLTSSDGKTLKILDIVAIITQAVQENRQVITRLFQQVNEQKDTIANLTARINVLEDQNLEVEITSLRTRIQALEDQNQGGT